jgi:DNA repair protein RecN (Recombination protein N)
VASLPQPHEKKDDQAPSKLYIFDEIDTGTSGQAAKTIGQQLQRLAGAGHQVLVVTHQAVVAAAAHQHWWVHKIIEHGEAKSHVQTALSLPELTELLTHMAMGVSEDREAFSPEFAENLLRRMQPTSNSMPQAHPLVQ